MAASTPTDTELETKIPFLRENFTTKFADVISAGESYIPSDVERFKEDDRYAKCFVRSFWKGGETSLDETAAKVDEIFKYRKSINLSELSSSSFPAELTDRNALYWKGKDIDERKVLIFNVSRHKKGSLVDEMKVMIAYTLEQHHKETPGDPDRIIVIFDFTNAGVTNMDLDVVKYIISALSTYFPGILNRILLFEMPWLLSSIWKVIQTWLTQEQKDRITMVKKADIQKFIEAAELEPHMVK